MSLWPGKRDASVQREAGGAEVGVCPKRGGEGEGNWTCTDTGLAPRAAPAQTDTRRRRPSMLQAFGGGRAIGGRLHCPAGDAASYQPALCWAPGVKRRGLPHSRASALRRVSSAASVDACVVGSSVDAATQRHLPLLCPIPPAFLFLGSLCVSPSLRSIPLQRLPPLSFHRLLPFILIL